MLGNRVCNRFCLDLLGIPRQPRLFRRQLLRINGMQLLVSHFMDQCLGRLHFAHALLKSDPLIHCVVVPLGSGWNVLKADRHRTGPFQCLKEHLIIRDTAGKLIYADGREGPAVSLTHVKDVYDLEGRDHDFLQFLCCAAVRIKDRLSCDRIDPIHFHLLFVGSRSKNTDTLFAFLNLPAEVLLPGSIPGDQCGVGLLHGDQDRIVQGIIVEFGERLQVILEGLALEKRLNTGFQLVGDFLNLIELGGIGFIESFSRHRCRLLSGSQRPSRTAAYRPPPWKAGYPRYRSCRSSGSCSPSAWRGHPSAASPRSGRSGVCRSS